MDNAVRATLPAHLPGALGMAADQGRVSANTAAEQMILVLQPSIEQQRELRRVLDEQQDQNALNYHQWLTPDQYGQYFGVADEDIAQVSDWLSSQGFSVDSVSKSKRLIRFSGTVGQIESAFQTEIHSYQVNGETHVSNSRGISVPAALSQVIGGVTLNDFFRKGQTFQPRKLSDVTNPLYTNTAITSSYTGPGDFAVLYNTKPLLQAGYNGAGTSIAVVGRTDINLSDVQTYRQMFGLTPNDPIFIHAGPDGGVEPGDDGESYLDVEISGGVAPGAKVYFVIGTPTYLVDGITNSMLYIVENNLADIMSISYGSCEANDSTGGLLNLQLSEQAAAQGISVFVSSGDNGPAGCDSASSTYEHYGYAVSSDASNPYTVAVGGSEFYEGAAFATYWGVTDPVTFTSALGYAPETAWNEAKGADKTSTASSGLSGLWSDSGGLSAFFLQPSWQRGPGVPSIDPTLTGGLWVNTYTITNAGSGYVSTPTVTFAGGGCTGLPRANAVLSGGTVVGLTFVYTSTGQGIGCTSAPTVTFTAAPAGGTTATATVTVGPMQTPVPFVSGVPHRYLPDLSLNAASGHDGTLYCAEGVCQLNSSGGLANAGIVGGTSVAAPSMAGIQALIDQYNGGRQGMPGYIYYALAAAQNTANCNSSTPPAAGSNCAFQDITLGDNLVCGTSTCTATTGTKIGFNAGVGYDLATGLGSVNANNLALQWKSVVFNSTSTTLGVSQSSGTAQGSPATLTGKVSPGSGGGVPSGDVAFIVSKGALTNGVDSFNTGILAYTPAYATLDGNGNYTVTLTNLPAGTYTVTARYAGDNTYASSLSTPVTVTVATGNSAVAITPEYFNDTTLCDFNFVTSYNYGQFAWIPATVTATSGQGVPTGTVTFTLDGVALPVQNLDPEGNGYLASGTMATSSCLAGYIFATSPTLTAGTHVIGASYSGDGTFAPATATPVTVTVNKLTVTPTLTAGQTYIASGATLPMTATFTVSALTGYTSTNFAPTGTVTFTDTTTSTVLGTASVTPTVTFSGNVYTYGGFAELSTSSLTAAGAHAITATYSGDTNFTSTTSVALTITVETGAGTTTTVTSSANPSALNGRPTLTATIGLTDVGTAPTSGTVSFYDNLTGTPVLLGTGTVGAAHTATYRPASGAALWAGAHPITATYGGTATYAGSTSAVFTQAFNQGTTTIALTVKAAGTYEQLFTLSAVITPSASAGAIVPNKGAVQFWDGATLLGSAVPQTITSTQGGYGLWTAAITPKLTAGTHTITTTYSDIDYATSTSNTQTITINKAAQAISFTLPSPVTYGVAPITLAATGGGSGNPIAYSVVSGPGTVAGSILTVTGAGTIVVSADQAGDSNYTNAPQVTQSLTVNKAAQTITFNPTTPVTYGVAPITLSSTGGGSGIAVVYTVASGPGTIAGSVLTVTGAGSIAINADLAGNGNYLAASQVTKTVVVNKATPAAVLSSSVSSVLVTNPVTLTARVTGSTAPTGTVSFLDGATLIGTGTLASGTATLTVSNLAVGAHTLTLAYPGDSNFNPVSTGAITVTVQDFTLGLPGSGSATSQTILPGGTATYSLTFTPTQGGTFPTATSLTASGQPTGSVVTFSPAAIAAGSSTATETLTIRVPAVGSSQASNVEPNGLHGARSLAYLSLALLLLPFSRRFRRTGRKLGRMLPLLILLVAGAGLLALSGCTAVSNGYFGQAQKTYTIQITGTSGNLIHSTSVTLTVE